MRAFLLCLSLLFPAAVLAVGNNITIGPAAQNALGVVTGVAELVSAVLYIAATVMFVSAILKLRIHRQNPQQVPIATPITEFVLAVVLGALPYLTEMATRTFTQQTPSVLAPHIQAHQQQKQAR
ncbi:MAG: hypothetical protein ACHQAX_03970 [Gammaproteobacteria bacterium]